MISKLDIQLILKMILSIYYRYRYEDEDDLNDMETSYAAQMKEEAIRSVFYNIY